RALRSSGGTNGEQLGVRGRVLIAHGAVACTRDHIPVADDDRTDRHVTGLRRAASLDQSESHPVVVTHLRHCVTPQSNVWFRVLNAFEGTRVTRSQLVTTIENRW